jgi:hypothetical protein
MGFAGRWRVWAGVFLVVALCSANGVHAAGPDEAALRELAGGSHRAPGHAERNVHRHPPIR